MGVVALRKESVDRNKPPVKSHTKERMSLSARRAWIEIFYYADKDADWVVALRKESVDRNDTQMGEFLNQSCRSPQGERG